MIRVSPSLRYLDAASGWTVRRARPGQLRNLEQPFAFSADESLLAVPSGDTGVQVLETADGEIIAELLTPSRATQISFFKDRTGEERLATLDGRVPRVWDWQLPYVLRGVCERRNPDLAIEAAPDVPLPRAKSEVCSDIKRAKLNGDAIPGRAYWKASPAHFGFLSGDREAERFGFARTADATADSDGSLR